MKKILTLSIYFILISISSVFASEINNKSFYGNNYGKSYIFVEQNVEFSIYPDGQFDFTHLGNYNGNNVNVSISSPNVNVSFNSGFNYEMFVQYDDYGAVIQIENVPIYYDGFGRIIRAGNVDIRYNNRRIVQVGGLFVHYNFYGHYSHYTGYINPYNYYYVYRPWHTFYVRPIFASCIVYDYPYRRFYAPTRYSYYNHHNYYSNRGRNNVAYNNGRRSFHKPGSRVHYKGGRTIANRDYKPNRRNSSLSQTSRRDNSNARIATTNTIRRTIDRSKKNNLATTNNSNSRPAINNNTFKRSNRNTSTKVANKRIVSQNKRRNSYSSANKPMTTVNRHKKENNISHRSYSNKGKSTQRVASNTQRKSSSNSTSNTRRTSSKRGRGK